MFKKSMLACAALVALFGFVQTSSAELVGYWSFDEGEGDVAKDGSGYGNDGVIVNATWEEGKLGSALGFDGASAYVEVPDHESLHLWERYTFAAWIYQVESRSSRIIDKIGAGTANGPHLDTHPGQRLRSCSGACISTTFDHSLDEWHHAAITFDNGDVKLYLDGSVAGVGTAPSPLAGNDLTLRIGADSNGGSLFLGLIDDVQVYNHALAEAEILKAMEGLAAGELAGDPMPEDGVADVLRDTVLEWMPGEFAAAHDVYFGTAFNDVNEADRANPNGLLVSQDHAESTYDVGILDFGQTYYWRVDEVNAPPDATIFKGEVWSFTVEAFSIPVEVITATASSANAGNMGPENTIHGVGLNELDQHSTEGTEMWLSGMGDAAPSIQYAFDKPYKLHEMWVWNSNQLIESFVGIGAKDVVIETSVDGTEWTILEASTQLAQAPGSPTYTANTTVDFGGVLAQHVRMTINAGWGMLPQYGISEVRFFYVPTLAREPMPAVGDTSDGANVVLSWRAGREASSHQVKLGTDAQYLPLVGSPDESRYNAGALEYGTTYYWQIIEVNEAETPSSYAGELWSFSTPTHGTVDSFDQYDDNCNRIFFAWEDGLGHNGGEEVEDCDVPASNGNGGGSIVGNDTAPFAEKTIVNAGSTQSLPFNYDNSFGPSEAMLRLDGQDWTASSVQTLAIAFSGTAGNTGTLYVKINNTKIVYDREATDIAQSAWQAWNIDLTGVSGLQNVTSLTIGVDGGNAAGMLYIDDIRLYALAGELITPADPGTANLAGAWNFDAGSGSAVADSSGNGHDGVIEGNANSWVPGKEGNALSMGNNVYVSVAPTAWSSIDAQFTVAFWVLGDDALGNNWGFYAGDAAGRLVGCHLAWGGQVIFDTTANWNSERVIKDATADELTGQWHHWIFMKNAETGEKKIYLDGRLYASGSGSADPIAGVDRFFIGAGDAGVNQYLGLMDEFQLYDRALSAEEALWLAGVTSPIHKPL